MQAVKKVEIIIGDLEVDSVLEILNQVNVSGYTVMKNTSGKGDRGISNDDLGTLFSNSYIMTVCTNEKQLEQLVTTVTPLLRKIGGICLVTESSWASH